MRKLAIILLFAATASAGIFLNSFNSGQLSEDMLQRHDLDRTSMGSEELTNILIRPQGMAYKRPGTEFIADTNDEDWVEPVPPIPPAATRDEAYVMANNTTVAWLDSSFNVLSHVAVVGSCFKVDVDSDGIVVAGHYKNANGYCISRWDADMNLDEDFFVPDGGWPSMTSVTFLRFSDDDTRLYVETDKTDIICFDTTTGAQMWESDRDGTGNFGVTSDNILYISGGNWGFWAVFNADGVDTGGDIKFAGFERDVWIDNDNGRLYACGSSSSPGWTYPEVAVGVMDLDGGNQILLETTGLTSTMWSIIKVGDYIYTAGSRLEQAGGGYASVWKFTTDLELVANYDTGFTSHAIIEAWDGNIAVRSGIGAVGENSGIYLLDTDLNFISYHYINTQQINGMNMRAIPFMDDGTPAVPGYWNKYGSRIDRSAVVRLIPFEYSTDDAYVIELGHQYIGFLRTTP